MSKLLRVLILVLVVMALSMVAAMAVFAAPISVTAFTSVVTDITDTLGGVVPTIIVAVMGTAVGYFVIKIGWKVVRGFIK